jgi:hypothetical protein
LHAQLDGLQARLDGRERTGPKALKDWFENATPKGIRDSIA